VLNLPEEIISAKILKDYPKHVILFHPSVYHVRIPNILYELRNLRKHVFWIRFTQMTGKTWKPISIIIYSLSENTYKIHASSIGH
jgi:hypothetical protein